MTAPLRVVIHGAGGRMGQRLVALGSAEKGIQIVAALEWSGHERLGEDAGIVAGTGPLQVPLSDRLTTEADVLIDFSNPSGAESALRLCRDRKLPLVLATTGLEPELIQRVQAATRELPILWSPSMSLSVNLVMKLTEISAKALRDYPSGVDVEIIERHHRFKEDAPSGTALKFGQIVAAAMGQTEARHGRQGRPGARPPGEIGYHAVRIGDNPGEHSILFGLLGETIELNVKATSRDCYAQGALAAARFLVGKPPGHYGMADVLGL